ncbi:unnamed protein product, partial [Rotaria magnacalcarata]
HDTNITEATGIHETSPTLSVHDIASDLYDDSLHMPDPNVIRSTTTSSFKENRNNSKIITFSHFLTSKKLMKAYIDEMSLRRQQCQRIFH